MVAKAERVLEIERALVAGGISPRRLLVAEWGERVLILAAEDDELERARDVLVSAGFAVEYTPGGEPKAPRDIPGVIEQEAASLLVG